MRKLLFIVSILLLTSCGAQSAATQVPATGLEVTEVGLLPEVLTSPTATKPTTSAGSQFSPTAPASPTLEMTPTETSLPPLALPSPLPNPPALLAWDGQPTYLGDSKPGYYFRLRYDPEIWALTTDSFGYAAIAHRGIEYCVIAPAFGRGLPANLTVEHDVRRVGAVEYEISTAYMNGARQFVTYLSGDGNIYTGFEVTFKENADLCLQEAEVVFATLTSVQVSQATPIP
jgi:hypothetical protein